MTLVQKSTQLRDITNISKPTKSGIRAISEMSTSRILMYVAGRHKVGLLGLSSFVMASYIAYDKVVRLFI